jgi:hypothetical protein
MGQKRNTYRLYVGTPERKKQFGRPRHRWVCNEKDLKEIELGRGAGLDSYATG